MKRLYAAVCTLLMCLSLWDSLCVYANAEQEPLEGNLFLTVSSITFSIVGESEDIYLGMIPREYVNWESDDPSIVSVDKGVLTANGVGTTTIRATYYDRQVECTAGCLAEDQQALDQLSAATLSQPKRLLPEVDLDTPCTYFDDAALVGDSITYMMVQVENRGNYLGDLLFMARGGASLNSFVLHYMNVFYQGIELYLESAIEQSGVKRMYILIGSTDLACDPQREIFFENWDTLLGRIREKSPDVEIVIISNIPRYAPPGEDKGSFFVNYNKYVAQYNSQLREYCAENGCMYLDLCSYIEDHSGKMAAQYNLDGFHLNDAGYFVWMKVMRYYAQYELEGGILQ